MANKNRMIKDLETVRDFSAPADGGTTRLTYTPEYRQAADYVIAQMQAAGLETREDGLGNIFGLRRGNNPDAPKIISGSHLDTVKNAGYFDGQAGIFCALEAARMLEENNIQLESDFEVAALVMEEGARYPNVTGSKYIMGVNTDEMLDRLVDDDGITLRQAIQNYGLSGDITGVCRKDEKVKAFLELHIEQNAKLERAGKDVGIVDTIWGGRWFNVTVNGVTDHASTPMEERQDAMLAAAAFIHRMGNFISGEFAPKATMTVGRMNLRPDQINAIANQAKFTIDFRSGYEANFDDIDARMAIEAAQVEKEYRVKVEYSVYSYTPPCPNSLDIVSYLEESVQELGYSSMHLDSRAGHDAMVFGIHWPIAMLFIPSHLGLTHCPDEWTDYEYVAKGADILYETIKKIDAR
ncbi:MAG: M20 family metallo-hydrolase [Lachnospiraceae bacterium]|nr:M20 family metallo-hydrolase [Lachnospiraceae bacterium]